MIEREYAEYIEEVNKSIDDFNRIAKRLGVEPTGGDVPINMAFVLKLLRAIERVLDSQPCEDVISRKSIKQKLQEHHDFFVNAYGGFSNLPQNDKSRVDEITNCIAMVINEPPVTPTRPTGHWTQTNEFFINRDGKFIYKFICSECKSLSYFRKSNKKAIGANVCPNCGADMREGEV